MRTNITVLLAAMAGLLEREREVKIESKLIRLVFDVFNVYNVLATS